MNDPIDILEIAQDRYTKALDEWRVSRYGWGNLSFTVPQLILASAVDVARDDLWRARQLSNDVTLAVATGQLDGASIAKLESLPGRTDAPSQSPPER